MMRDTFKKILTVATFALFTTLPLGAQAADENIATTTTTAVKGSVKEILAEIRSMPRGSDGEVIKTNEILPFGTKDTNVAGCIVCVGGVCFETC